MYSSLTAPSDSVALVWMGDSVIEPGIGHRSDPVLGADLVFTISDAGCAVALQGPVTKRTTYPHRPGTDYIGVRFMPGVDVFPSIDGPSRRSMRELCDGSSPVRSLGRFDLDRLGEELSKVGTLAERGRLVRARLAADPGLLAPPPSPLIAAALSLFENRHGPVRVAEVSRRLGVSERTLQREFSTVLGVTPKHAARIVRVNRLVGELGRASKGNRMVDLARMAVSVGFYDQSHMTNDVSRVLGTTPSAVAAEAAGYNNADKPSK